MTRMLKSITALLLATGALVGTGTAADLTRKRVIFVSCGPSYPWCKTFNVRVVGLLKDAKVDLKVLESDLDPIQVNQQMAQATAEAPDLVIVLPADDKSLVAAVKKAKA